MAQNGGEEIAAGAAVAVTAAVTAAGFKDEDCERIFPLEVFNLLEVWRPSLILIESSDSEGLWVKSIWFGRFSLIGSFWLLVGLV